MQSGAWHHRNVPRCMCLPGICSMYRAGVCVADFGVSRILKKQDRLKRSLTGMTGTRRYMAPEVAVCLWLQMLYELSVCGYIFVPVDGARGCVPVCGDLPGWIARPASCVSVPLGGQMEQ